MVRLLVFAMLVWGAYHLVKKFLRCYHEHFAPERQQQDYHPRNVAGESLGEILVLRKGSRSYAEELVVTQQRHCDQGCLEDLLGGKTDDVEEEGGE